MITKCLKILIIIFVPISLLGQELIIANERNNVLYNGIENPISFALKSIKAEDIEIVVKKGVLEKNLNHLYYKNCTRAVGIVWFYAINKKTKKTIDSLEFRLKKFPDPEIYPVPTYNIAYERGYIGKNILLDSRSIRGRINGFEDYGVPIEIMEFTIAIASIDLQSKIILNPGAMFTNDVTESFKNLQDKDTVTLSCFKVKVGCEDFSRTLTQKSVYQKQGEKMVRLESN